MKLTEIRNQQARCYSDNKVIYWLKGYVVFTATTRWFIDWKYMSSLQRQQNDLLIEKICRLYSDNKVIYWMKRYVVFIQWQQGDLLVERICRLYSDNKMIYWLKGNVVLTKINTIYTFSRCRLCIRDKNGSLVKNVKRTNYFYRYN